MHSKGPVSFGNEVCFYSMHTLPCLLPSAVCFGSTEYKHLPRAARLQGPFWKFASIIQNRCDMRTCITILETLGVWSRPRAFSLPTVYHMETVCLCSNNFLYNQVIMKELTEGGCFPFGWMIFKYPCNKVVWLNKILSSDWGIFSNLRSCVWINPKHFQNQD